MSKIAMQKMAEAVKKFLPKDFGCTILVFPYGNPGIANYISTAHRADMIKHLRDTADRLENDKPLKLRVVENQNKCAENALRQIALELPEFCNIELEFEEMTINAVKRASEELKMFRGLAGLSLDEAALPIFDVSGSFCGKVTTRMTEARKVVDDYIQEKGFRPSYRTVAEMLNIKCTAAYARLRGYRHKMVRRQFALTSV